MDNFSDWLKKELISRNWKQADLVREANLDSAVISNIINGKRKAGESTAKAIAHALKLPPDLVFEKAGMLPAKTELSLLQRALLNLSKDMPDSDIQLLISILEQRQKTYKENPSTRPAK